MPAVTITPASGGGVTYANTGSFDAGGKWCESASFTAKQNGMDFPSAAGEDGSGSKNYGSRTRKIVLNVVYVAGSEALCYSGFQGDTDGLSKQPSAISGIGSFARCFLEGIASKIDQPKSNGLTLYWARATLVFTSRE